VPLATLGALALLGGALLVPLASPPGWRSRAAWR
jgi:hypothetical protein